MSVHQQEGTPNDTGREWLSAEWSAHGVQKAMPVGILERIERAAMGIRGIAQSTIVASGVDHYPAPHIMESLWQAVLSMASSIECEMEAARMRTPGAQA